jgi:hypothetical protein
MCSAGGMATVVAPTLPGAAVGEPKARGRLDTTLARLDELSRALGTGASHVDPVALLSELRVDLELYFAREEGDSYFGALVRERPSLSQDVSELRRTHATLLERLDALRTIAADPTRWPELRSPTLELRDALRIHEQQEGALLQELVLRDDGTGPD